MDTNGIKRSKSSHGGVLITVLVFVLITSIILAGIGKLLLSDYNLTSVESSYDNAIYAAEAGVNYEINKISLNAANADQKQSGTVPGTSYSTTAGVFSVYVTLRNADGSESTPWVAGSKGWIHSTGTVNTASRQVKIAIQGVGSASSTYAAFGGSGGIIHGAAATITGDIGTNGSLTFDGGPTVTGSVIFNGAGSTWSGKSNSSYTIVNNPTASSLPTVETVAVNTFGSTGLAYVAAHNDNSLAVPIISNPALSISSGTQTFVGKSGGANYYLTSLNCTGNSIVAFNNTNGPITIWVGPSGASSTFIISGGAAAVKMASDATKPVKIYIATTNDVTLNGNAELDAGIYNLNNSNSGSVILSGSPTVNGAIVSNSFTFNGNVTVNYEAGMFSLGGTNYYGTAAQSGEIGGMY